MAAGKEAEGMTMVPSGVELTALLQDIGKKQELADALQSSLDKHQEAIKSLGQEMLQLKKAQARLEEGNASMKGEIAEHKGKSVLSSQQIYSADREVLAVAHATLAQRLAFVLEENRVALARIQKLQNEMIVQNELNIKIEALQQAHASQAAVLAALKTSHAEAAADKRDLLRHQQAITALERMADETARVGGGRESELALSDGVRESPAFSLLRAENAALAKAVDEARVRSQALEQVEAAGSDIASLQRYLEQVKARHTDLSERNLVLKKRAEATPGPIASRRAWEGADAEEQAEATQQELVELGKAHAAEELALEMKIMEARTIAQHGFSSTAAFVLNEPTAGGRRMLPTAGGGAGVRGGVAGGLEQEQPWHLARRGTPPSRLEPLGTFADPPL